MRARRRCRWATGSLVAVSCATHKPLPPPVGSHDPQLIATTRCYKVTPASAAGAPLYAVFQAPIGDCGSSGGLVHPYFDCISEDYLLLLPSCNSPAAKLAPALEMHTMGDGFTWDSVDLERSADMGRLAKVRFAPQAVIPYPRNMRIEPPYYSHHDAGWARLTGLSGTIVWRRR